MEVQRKRVRYGKCHWPAFESAISRRRSSREAKKLAKGTLDLESFCGRPLSADSQEVLLRMKCSVAR